MQHSNCKELAAALNDARCALRVVAQFNDMDAARDFVLDFLEGGDRHLNSLTTKEAAPDLGEQSND